ncbi:MAG: endolytic transglycosylase MltG, partial [Flavobacteriales bacterium]
SPVRVVIRGQRLPADMAGTISKQLEADSAELKALLTSEEQASKYGFNSESFRTMILPNTYEFNWNSSAEDVIARMAREYKAFWNSERIAKAQNLGLSQSEVGTLASIVKAETAKSDEAPKVAGLYLNRLEIGMALQADPTLIYAIGDFSIKRVLDKHKLVDSKYNTYKHPGLPPGPINYPETNYIDAVLNSIDHKFIYMCAKPDFSGYHDFSKTYNQHLNYARKYHQALRKNGIYR